MRLFFICALCAVIAQAQPASQSITEADCTAAKLGSGIPVSAIGLPVSGVTLAAPQWHGEAGGYCSIEGSMAPVDQSKTARPIRCGVALPAVWTMRAAQLGGGGMNGVIPRLNATVSRGGAPKWRIQLRRAPIRKMTSAFWSAKVRAGATESGLSSGTTPLPIGVGRNGS